MHWRIHSLLLLVVSCALAQDAAAPGSLLTNTGAPMKIRFVCADEDLTAAGMSCSDEYPCPVYLELNSVSATGRKLSLAGDLHGRSTTLESILLSSEDNGAGWKEAGPRMPGVVLDQVQLLDATHGWAAGETEVPLARDPFVLITTDGGVSWQRKALTEEGAPGDVQKFWFDSAEHGELIMDAGPTAEGDRYILYESKTGGQNWNVAGKMAQMPRLRRAPVAEDADYRIGTDSRSHSFVIEKRTGETWTRVASFLVQVASCGSPVAASVPETSDDAK